MRTQGLQLRVALLIVLLCGVAIKILFIRTPPAAAQREMVRNIYFEENRGQTDSSVLMLARLQDAFVALREDRIDLITRQRGESQSAVGLKWISESHAAELAGEGALEGRTSYLVGNRPDGWLTDLKHFSTARYREIYPGIDLVVHADPGGSNMEYDFVVEPGADPRKVEMEFTGSEEFEMTERGDLHLKTEDGALITHHAPVAYQMEGERREYVATAFKLLSTAPLRVGFDVAPYDRSRELVIDPVLEYGRFLGGGQEDEILSIAVDKDGYVYMTGETSSPDLPLAGGSLRYPSSVFQTKGNTLAFVAKLDPTGTKLIYCTYLGGGKTAVGHNLKIDSAGNAYVGGRTEASDFPLMNPIQPKFGGGSDDGFITKLNAAGNALIYSTYIGGSEYDQGRALAVDSAGNAYMTGITESANFPVKNPIQAKYAGKQDSFVLKLNAAGNAILYSTYIGGSGDDVGHAIAVDALSNAYITGLTNSTDFPTANPLQRNFKGGEGDDTVVVKINAAGTALVYSTFMGGSKDDEARAIAVDGAGNAVVTGYTQSADFPLLKPLQAKFGGGSHDILAYSLAPGGAALNWSTFFGGSGGDFGRGLALDSAGNVFLTGYTDSKDFPLASPSQNTYAGGTADVFYAKLDQAAQKALLSSFLGGDSYERGRGMAVSSRGEIFISGRTESKNFPVSKPHSPLFGGGPNDAFIVKIR